jgi:hypothetical protein
MEEIKRSCGVCKFVHLERLHPTQIDSTMVCRRFPPCATTLPAPNGQMAQFATNPIVLAQNWCHEFAPREDIAKIALD